MRTKDIHYLLTGLLLCLGLFSCRKEIDINLNDSNPIYVIEANVTDLVPMQTVSIILSKNFSENNVFPYISDALVVLTDSNASFSDTLQNAEGVFYTDKWTATPGNTYKLYIKVGGKEFTATSTMPKAAVPLDSFYAVNRKYGPNDFYFPVIKFNDPAEPGNFYRCNIYKGGNYIPSITIGSDELTNGQENSFELFVYEDTEENFFKVGDTLSVEFQSITADAYNYWYTLNETIGQNSAAPANPKTNIKGGAFGYFSTHCSKVYQTIIK